MLSKETFHPVEDVKSVLLVEGQVSSTLDLSFLERGVLS